ncbi:MAG: universal stress protein [Proteobacteria bacterium]|nr:universal stress protein [Pseudomonadota bacterium]
MTHRRPSLPASPRRILVVVDPAADPQPTLDKAALLARAWRARLVAYCCDFREGLDGRGRAVAQARARQQVAGAAALGRLLRAGLRGQRAEVRYELGHPAAPRILAAVRRERAELVIAPAHFHGAARRTLFGPADWPLIRDCPVPLLYVRPTRWPAAPRVAAAVDPLHPADPSAALDRQLVGQARRLARALHGSLAVVHAWLPLEPVVAQSAMPGLPVGSPALVGRLLAEAEQRARAAVEALCRGGGPPPAQPVLLRGSAVETLPGFAEVEGLDLLVLGAIARSRLYEALVGATAERLLERVGCDLLVVKARRPRRDARGGLPV